MAKIHKVVLPSIFEGMGPRGKYIYLIIACLRTITRPGRPNQSWTWNRVTCKNCLRRRASKGKKRSGEIMKISESMVTMRDIPRSWGQEKILKMDGANTIKMLEIYPGFSTGKRAHKNKVFVYVIEGYVLSSKKKYCGGTLFSISGDGSHSFRADHDAFGCKLLEITHKEVS